MIKQINKNLKYTKSISNYTLNLQNIISFLNLLRELFKLIERPFKMIRKKSILNQSTKKISNIGICQCLGNNPNFIFIQKTS